LYHYAARKDVGWNVPSILEVNKRFGVSSTFFLQTRYGRDDSYLSKTSQLLRQEGYDIGLHAAHSAHLAANALQSEVELFTAKTGSKPVGIRHHVLRFRVPETWRIESENGFEYDCTFSHNEYFGFQSGVCYPYHPIDGQRLPILELPTSFMDWTALKRRERGEALLDRLQSTMNRVEEHNGVFVSNFHNTYLNEESFPDVMGGYSWLLAEASKRGYWVATAQQCVEWWTHRTSEKPCPRLSSDKTVLTKSNIPVEVEQNGKSVVVGREN
jgi:peptidoglycan/xylan/chitin deacetylase (PgdA/CDA1 family)